MPSPCIIQSCCEMLILKLLREKSPLLLWLMFVSYKNILKFVTMNVLWPCSYCQTKICFEPLMTYAELSILWNNNTSHFSASNLLSLNKCYHKIKMSVSFSFPHVTLHVFGLCRARFCSLSQSQSARLVWIVFSFSRVVCHSLFGDVHVSLHCTEVCVCILMLCTVFSQHSIVKNNCHHLAIRSAPVRTSTHSETSHSPSLLR